MRLLESDPWRVDTTSEAEWMLDMLKELYDAGGNQFSDSI